ncbi:MAG: class I SAM-dependent methyltransferase [Gemmatimonadaceae bacterium]
MTTVERRDQLKQRSGSEEADWFEEWFGVDYLRIYQHRDETEAEQMVDLIAAHTRGTDIRSVLDLGCGAGRHSRHLCERWWTVGLDLSAALLRIACREMPDAPYVRADMRELPFEASSFDLVVNLFTSFGYFEDDLENARVLSCVRSALRPGGAFVMDFLNAAQVRNDLVPYDERVENGITIEQRRAISPDDRFVEKTIRLRERGKEYIERVRLLSSCDLERMLDSAGFDVSKRVGDYSGAPWLESSPRTIIFAMRR